VERAPPPAAFDVDLLPRRLPVPALSETEGWGSCLNLIRTGVIPSARAFTSGRRDLACTRSIPRLGLAAVIPKLARPKLSVKVGCHNFQIYICGKPRSTDLRNSSTQRGRAALPGPRRTETLFRASAPVVILQNEQPKHNAAFVPEGQLKIAQRFNAGYMRDIRACPGGAPDPRAKKIKKKSPMCGDRAMVRVRWVPHFSRAFCARSGEVCINLLRTRRHPARTCSIPSLRSLPAVQPQTSISKFSVKVGRHNFEIYACGKF